MIFGGNDKSIDDKVMDEIRSIKEVTKHFNVNLDSIMMHQSHRSKSQDDLSTTGMSLHSIIEEIDSSPLPIPASLFPIPRFMVVMAMRNLQNNGLFQEGVFFFFFFFFLFNIYYYF
jgi:hypothetical protein